MRIVTAGMHSSGDGGRERKARVLLHWKCIHVAAKKYAAALLARVQHCHRARARRTLAPFERKVGELGAHLGQGLGSFEPHFGLGMDCAAERSDPISDSAGILKQVFGQHAGDDNGRSAKALSGAKGCLLQSSSTCPIRGTPHTHQADPTAAIAAVRTKALS